MATDGQSKKYDQEFFLALAAKGKDAWNAWRRDPANKDVPVTFAGVDFSVAPNDQINFSGFEFGDYADFSNCKWQTAVFKRTVFGDHAKFGNAIFNGWADFTGATFSLGVQFCSADFGGGAFFRRTKFSHEANFKGATFGTGVTFERAIFGHNARFEGVSLGHKAVFKRTIFRGDVSFDAADFGTEASFEQAIFDGSVNFKGRSKEDWDSVFQLTFVRSNAQYRELLSALKARHIDLWTNYQSGPDRFSAISFADTQFDGKADFSGRSFEHGADFTGARFYYPPNFDNTSNAGLIDFTGARIGFGRPLRFHWTSDTKIPLRLRAFRKVVEETKNHHLERDLYIEERKAERGVYWHQRLEELKDALKNGPEELKKKIEDIRNRQRGVLLAIIGKIGRLAIHGLWILVMFLYWALGDYGRSFLRPFAWLIATGFFFYWRYLAVLAPITREAGPANAEKYDHAVRMLALGNTVPFVGPLTIDAEIEWQVHLLPHPSRWPVRSLLRTKHLPL
jgi:uncharacterized protein YjbI with pentapeptide repeats